MMMHEFYPYCQRMTQPTENEQLTHQSYHQLSTMPPMEAGRCQSCLARVHLRAEDLWSPLGQVTPFLTQMAFEVQDDDIFEESDQNDEQITANREDDLSNGLRNNLSNIVGDNVSDHEPPTQSKITSMQHMLEEHWERLNNAIQQNTQLCAQNAKLGGANWEYCRETIRPEATKTKIFHMTHPEWYCAGAKEGDYFLHILWSTFQSHVHLFPPGDPDKVNYKGRLLSPWKPIGTLNRERHRLPIRLSGIETYRESQIPDWNTFKPARKKCRRCTVRRTEHLIRLWSVWPTSSKEHMIQLESTPIESKQIGEEQDVSRRRTRTFTKSLPAD